MTDFDTFWAALPTPMKKDKKYARTCFAKAIKETDLQTMLDAIEIEIKMKPDWKAYKHASTWLNKGCWDDEHETVPEVAAPFRSVETWSEKDFQDCAEIVTKVGRETAMRSYRYTQRQLEAVEGYLQPRSLTG